MAAGSDTRSPAEALAAHAAPTAANTAPSREAFLALVADRSTRSWEAAPRGSDGMPQRELRGPRPSRSSARRTRRAAFYNPPTEDGSRRGVYYLNTYDLPEPAAPSIASVTFHEANPGHHFQISLEQEMPERPALRRFGGILAGSAFAKGWGLYSERLADEMGLYLDDGERLGMLEAQGLRAGRLITDTGIHALGWSRERADRQARGGRRAAHRGGHRGRPLHRDARRRRSSYMIGMIGIQSARGRPRPRARARRSRSRDFHDRLLALGQLPLPALPARAGMSSVGRPGRGLDSRITRRPSQEVQRAQRRHPVQSRRSPWPTSSSIRAAGCRPKPAR